MAIKILMPALSPTMVEGNLARWHKKEGDQIKSGDVIVEIETDKAIMEVESADSGILGKIVVSDKTEKVKVNQLIGVILEEGEDKSAAEKLIKEHIDVSGSSAESISKDNAASISTIQYSTQPSTAIQSSAPLSRIFATPLAKRIAQQNDIDLSRVSGSGPKGRIVKEDVLKASKPAVTGYQVSSANVSEIVKNSQMRKVIAQRLQHSKQTIPHFYMSADCNVTYLLKLREEMNKKLTQKAVPASQTNKISVNDFIIKAAAHALKMVRNVNASWSEESIIYHSDIDISFAVATDEGLITPIIKNADQKSLLCIANEAKELAVRAKENSLKLAEFQGGTFTISNLGMYGIKEFKAIINPPQSCILAVGASEKRAIVKDETVIIADIMTISISCDHRVIDGAVAALFMNELKQYIENPSIMLI